ncbi:uncharacterized protein HKW66_Vig0079370 [Vigna angularis]|uniref:Uncharacterized protein n=1 Tax=Phaseolus angularis TaxID=3914 RepID=A0A8T0K5D0_PHAAN|nr:uncharacterized protein HKW66_Vig0079370 [Vigna angularis]
MAVCSYGGVQLRRCAATAVCSYGGVQLRRCAATAVCSYGGVQLRRCAATAVCSYGGVQLRRCAATAVCSYGGVQLRRCVATVVCSYGDKIQPRTHDNQLSYVGGDTKILAVNRAIKMRLFLFTLSSNPNSSFSSDRDRFLDALNSASIPPQLDAIKTPPVTPSNVDYLFGLDKAVSPLTLPPTLRSSIQEEVPPASQLQPPLHCSTTPF